MTAADRRPRLTPAVAEVRSAVRRALLPLRAEPRDAGAPEVRPAEPGGLVGLPEQPSASGSGPLVLIGLSGGPDSLALAAAAAFEAPRCGVRAGAVIVDHALQPSSDEVARVAAQQAVALGLDPVLIETVAVTGPGGPEAAARRARRAAFDRVLDRTGAVRVLLAHTLDDQAETVLLGLARGSGPDSLRGMSADDPPYLRPLLDVRRVTTVRACTDQALTAWTDPQNADPAFTRVRVRGTVLPVLERELGPGVAPALARTATQLGEDAQALDAMAAELAPDLVEFMPGGVAIDAAALAAHPRALVHRIVRLAVESEFGVTLSRSQTLQVASLVLEWRGQGAVHLPGLRVERRQARLMCTAASDIVEG